MENLKIEELYHRLEANKCFRITEFDSLQEADSSLKNCRTLEEFASSILEKAEGDNPLYSIIAGDLYSGNIWNWREYNGDEQGSYNRDLAIKYYQKAIDLGSKLACCQLGDLYSGYALKEGDYEQYYGGKEALQEAIKKFLKDKLDSNRQKQLEEKLTDLKRFIQVLTLDYQKSTEIYQLGMERGSLYCQQMLALNYYYGNGVEKDYIKARKLFDKLWENTQDWLKPFRNGIWSLSNVGRTPLFLYGLMLLKGLGGTIDLSKAEKVFEKGWHDEIVGCGCGLAQTYVEQKRYKDADKLYGKLCKKDKDGYWEYPIEIMVAAESRIDLTLKSHEGLIHYYPEDENPFDDEDDDDENDNEEIDDDDDYNDEDDDDYDDEIDDDDAYVDENSDDDDAYDALVFAKAWKNNQEFICEKINFIRQKYHTFSTCIKSTKELIEEAESLLKAE